MKISLLRALPLCLLCTSGAYAQQQSFYRVYQYETPLMGWGEPTLWNTYVARSAQPYDHFGRSFSREGLLGAFG